MKLKKITSATLTVLVIITNLTLWAPLADATATQTLTIGSQSALNGATIDVPVMANISNIEGIQLSINYPGTLLSYVGCSSTHIVCSTDVASATNKVNLTWYDVASPLTLSNEVLLTLQFQVVNVGTSDANLTFSPVAIVDSTDIDITSGVTFTDGVISINPLSSIAITHPANKLTYTVGDPLDITGLVITGTYYDTSTKTETITAANITGFDSSVAVSGQVLTITVGGKTATYTINILSSAKDITSFSFPEGTGVITGTNIAVTVPFGTDVTALVPTIVVSPSASVNPASGVVQNFTNPVTYTVTAQNSSTQTYTVTVSIAPDPNIALLAADKAALVDDSIKGSNADLSNVTGALTNPLPSSGANGSTITWASSNQAVVSNDGQTVNRPAFADGDATLTLTATLTKGVQTDSKVFTLTVLKLPASDIATVTSGAYTVSAISVETNSGTITNVPFGISKAVFLAALTKNESHQTWDDTGITNPVVTGNTLQVTAQDGTTKVTYTITTSDDPDIALVSADRDALVDSAIKGGNADLLNITSALTNPLPSVGSVNGSTTISWASSNTTVVSNDGQTVNRPNFADGNATVTMTASLTKGLITQTKAFTLIVLKLPPSTVATLTSVIYTVSAVGTSSETIIDIPFGTPKATFVAALTKGEAHQEWDVSGLSDPVVTGNTLKVTAEDSVTTVVYTITVTPDTTAPTGSISNISADAYLKGTVTLNATASDVGSGVAKVEFWYATGTSTSVKIGEDATAPYSVDWNTTKVGEIVPEGSHSLSVKVYDVAGNSYQSDGITVTVDNTAPTVTKLGDDSTDLVLAVGNTDLVFSEVLSDSSKTAVLNALTAGADKTLTYSWAGATLTVTATEITTFINDVVVVNISDLAGNTAAELLLVDSNLTAKETSPDGSGTATVGSTTPQVVITNPTQAVTITISSETTDPTIDVGSLITNGSGTLPAITITSSNANNTNIAIPASTTVTSSDSAWSGIIAAPTITTVTLPEITGQTLTLSTAIEVGITGAKLSFNKAVRILLPNQAGKRAGYVRTGTAFTEITNTCAADNQITGDALVADGDCKIDVGSNLVIWTKHFTSFATYTQTTNSTGGGGGGGGGGSCCSGGGYAGSGSIIIGNGYVGGTPLFVPQPTQTPAVQTTSGKVLGAKTQRIKNGTIVKLLGEKQYYLIQNGKRVPITLAVFNEKYSKRTVIELDQKTLNDIPLKTISSKPLVTKQVITNQVATTPAVLTKTTVRVVPRSVRVWSGMGTDTTVIGGTWTGQTFDVLQEKDGWYKVVWNKGSAWIDGRWVKVKTNTVNNPDQTQPVISQEETSVTKTVVKVIPRSVRVWSGMGINTTVIGGTWAGQTFQVLDEKDGWYRVVWNKGSAWIDGRWVKKIN